MKRVSDFEHELHFHIPLWSEPFRYFVVANAAGAIAVVASLAAIWSGATSGTDGVGVVLLTGLREFLYGVLFAFVFAIIHIVIWCFKWFIAHSGSTVTLTVFNAIWTLGFTLLLILGYSHFFCNSFSLVEVVGAEILEAIPYNLASPMAGCHVSQGTVHYMVGYAAALMP